MRPFGESQHSTHEVEISNSCCSAPLISNKQKGKHFSFTSDVSTESQSTVFTEATSIDSSFHSGGSVEGIFSRPSFPSAPSNLYNINGSLKTKISLSILPKGTRISFSHEVLQRTTIGRHEFSEDEFTACWWRGDEYLGITKSCLKQILKLEKGTKLRDQGSVRGLESHTRLAGLAKTQTRRDAWDAVLFEQEEQIPFGVIDEETIALRYQDVSSSCQLWAHKVALDDQKAAQLVYDDALDEV